MMITINLTKQRLVLEENELLALLKDNPKIWATALKRGKSLKRYEAQTKRKVVIRI